jgi:hypothetical protein
MPVEEDTLLERKRNLESFFPPDLKYDLRIEIHWELGCK